MPACLSGAEPKPGMNGLTIFFDTNDLPSPVRDLINMVSPLSLVQQIVMAEVVDTLCSGNPDDPGGLDLGDLVWDMVGGAIPNPKGSPGTLGWWIGQKLQYYAFTKYCQCSGANPTPPPVIVPTPPSGAPQYPTDPDAQPQLRRIEENQGSSAEGLLTLYNGLLNLYPYSAETWFRQAQNYVQYNEPLQTFAMTGEGYQDLLPFTQMDGSVSQDVYGVWITLGTIPDTVKRRGTLTPRLYGVGSVYWDAAYTPAAPKDIVQRDSIHYDSQFILAPQTIQPYRLYWYLQPGVAATARQLPRSTDAPIYAPFSAYNGAYQPFYSARIPPGWSDPPFYPQASGSRVYALGSPP